ncbi:ABC transporter substrate-binding protein [Mesorhizobium sp. LHD-90]|uniref:ABC transporter substrate-binding protein n=1 Tax=Mesorhizobium sp. LHD-90 TaxID=3071414 RepID=UPI0027E0DEEF|nr:ABC transporter substrate-binding protein [Mesorhizobium sp. LHD-90]MDQ6438125.1 ABC transporter substrate-binding protein [Mesorhizobium sp. LHD-90]
MNNLIFSSALALSIVVATLNASWAQTLERISVGALRFTSSGPLFLAKERGYFRDEDLDVEIVFFEAAPNIAVATASGELTFGVTALTAAFYNLAAENRLDIVAGQAQEKKGHVGNSILVSKREYTAGTKRLEDLFSKPFGLTQFGSPSHYQLGQLAAAHGIPMEDIQIRAFQTLPNLVSALANDQVSWAIIAPPISTQLIEKGAVVELSRYSDHSAYQFGAVFAGREVVEQQPDMIRRFLRAYKKGLKDYSVLNSGKGSEASTEARVTAAFLASYVYPDEPAERATGRILGSALYVEPDGEVDMEDITRQIGWYYDQGLIKAKPQAEELVNLDFLR